MSWWNFLQAIWKVSLYHSYFYDDWIKMDLSSIEITSVWESTTNIHWWVVWWKPITSQNNFSYLNIANISNSKISDILDSNRIFLVLNNFWALLHTTVVEESGWFWATGTLHFGTLHFPILEWHVWASIEGERVLWHHWF